MSKMEVNTTAETNRCAPTYLKMHAGLKGTVLNMQPTISKGIVHLTITFLSLFSHSHVVPNLYSFISCAELKIRYFGESG